MTAAATCPGCSGARMLDVTGLRYDHTDLCTIRSAEDSRAEADRQALKASHGAPVTRPATLAEVLLGVPAGARVTVSAVSAGHAVVARTWVGG